MKFQMTHVDFVCAADIGWLRLHLVDLVFGNLGTMVPKKNATIYVGAQCGSSTI